MIVEQLLKLLSSELCDNGNMYHLLLQLVDAILSDISRAVGSGSGTFKDDKLHGLGMLILHSTNRFFHPF